MKKDNTPVSGKLAATAFELIDGLQGEAITPKMLPQLTQETLNHMAEKADAGLLKPKELRTAMRSAINGCRGDIAAIKIAIETSQDVQWEKTTWKDSEAKPTDNRAQLLADRRVDLIQAKSAQASFALLRTPVGDGMSYHKKVGIKQNFMYALGQAAYVDTTALDSYQIKPLFKLKN